MNISDAAMLLAMEAHNGHTNKHDGEPYIKHLARVWVHVRDAGGSEVQQAIAWLHDSVEDNKIDYSDIGEAFYDFPREDINAVVRGVDAITKRSESNEQYYRRLKLNEDARFVKLHGDIVDNFSRNHRIKDEATRLRMAAKYSLGVDILK